MATPSIDPPSSVPTAWGCSAPTLSGAHLRASVPTAWRCSGVRSGGVSGVQSVPTAWGCSLEGSQRGCKCRGKGHGVISSSTLEGSQPCGLSVALIREGARHQPWRVRNSRSGCRRGPDDPPRHQPWRVRNGVWVRPHRWLRMLVINPRGFATLRRNAGEHRARVLVINPGEFATSGPAPPPRRMSLLVINPGGLATGGSCPCTRSRRFSSSTLEGSQLIRPGPGS